MDRQSLESCFFNPQSTDCPPLISPQPLLLFMDRNQKLFYIFLLLSGSIFFTKIDYKFMRSSTFYRNEYIYQCILPCDNSYFND